MRTLSNPGNDLQLQLIQETSQQLTFQRGEAARSAAIEKGWRNSTPGIIGMSLFCGTILFIMWQGGMFQSIPANPIGVNLFLLVWSAGMFGIPLAVIVYSLLKFYFVVWTFDRLDLTLCREGVNLLSQKHTQTYRFDEINKIVVEQGEDSDSSDKCCELYITLKSGREFTLSQSCYTGERREQAISLHYHREIAEKMRDFLGHTTAEQDRADRIRIPEAREIAAEQAANWDLLKSVAGGLFSSKAKRQSDIDNIKERLITDRDNAQLWETLSIQLAMSKEHTKESIEALSQAEAIYRDRGDEVRADELARKIALFKAKI